MNEIAGFVRLPAAFVLDKTEKILAEREARVEARIEEAIKAEMGRRFFPAKTREKAERRLAEHILRIHLGGAYRSDQLAELRDAARLALRSVPAYAERTVFVSSELAAVIQRYLD